MRRVALYGFLASGNFGNDASFETARSWLASTYPELAISAVTIAPEELERRYGVPARALSWQPSGPWAALGRLPGPVRKLLGRLVDLPRSVRLAGSADAVVVPGMGVLESTLAAPPWGLPLWMFLMALACRARQRPFVLLDVGADPVGNPLTRWLFVSTARLAAHVSFRDEWSAAAMRTAGFRGAAPVLPDLAFAHPAPLEAGPVPGLVVAGVMAYYGEGDDPVAGAAVRDRYVTTLANALARLTDAGNRVVLLGGDEVDAEVARQVRGAVLAARPQLADGVVTVCAIRTFQELTEQMARAEVVIASRFHNLIAALRLARPTVSVGYAEKSAKLMEAVGLAEYCQRIGDLDGEVLLRQLDRVRAEAEAVTARVRAATEQYSDQVHSGLLQVAEEVLGLPPGRPAVPPRPTVQRKAPG